MKSIPNLAGRVPSRGGSDADRHRAGLPRKFACIGLALGLALALPGCVTTPPKRQPVFPDVTGTGFPESWAGVWSGQVQSHGPAGMLDQFSMQLTIAPTDAPGRFDWRMVLSNPSGNQEQPFSLLAIDRAAGRFAIDENNGVVCDATWIDNALYSHFDVGGSRVQIRYLRRVLPGIDELIVEMTMARVEDAHATGGNNGAPEVVTLPLRSVQRAVLRRSSAPTVPEGPLLRRPPARR
jgi:hypothetical protein